MPGNWKSNYDSWFKGQSGLVRTPKSVPTRTFFESQNTTQIGRGRPLQNSDRIPKKFQFQQTGARVGLMLRRYGTESGVERIDLFRRFSLLKNLGIASSTSDMCASMT
jgi:hypothetical protein